jgi:hypothetical protein
VNLPYEFDADTVVSQTSDGVFAAQMSAQWCACAGAPNGGYTLALCLQGLKLSVASAKLLDPLALSTTYLRPADGGHVGTAHELSLATTTGLDDGIGRRRQPCRVQDALS